MSMNRRHVLKGTLAAGIATSALKVPAAVAQAGPIKIGFLTIKTGPLASGGLQMEQGLLTFLKDRKNMLGNRPVELTTADTTGNPAVCRTKMQELVACVDFFRALYSNFGMGPDRIDFSTRPEMQRALGGEVATGTRRSDTLGTDLLFVAVPVASSGVDASGSSQAIVSIVTRPRAHGRRGRRPGRAGRSRPP